MRAARSFSVSLENRAKARNLQEQRQTQQAFSIDATALKQRNAENNSDKATKHLGPSTAAHAPAAAPIAAAPPKCDNAVVAAFEIAFVAIAYVSADTHEPIIAPKTANTAETKNSGIGTGITGK